MRTDRRGTDGQSAKQRALRRTSRPAKGYFRVEGKRVHDISKDRFLAEMKTSWIFCGALVIFWGAALTAAFYGLEEEEEEEEEKVLIDNKCQCVKVTSKFVPSKDNPQDKVLERNIRITVPLTARENISDPTSPVRTRFVYKLSKLCNKCNADLIQENHQGVTNGQSSLCNDPDEPCYTYDRNKCYTSPCLVTNGVKTETVKAALTPESCYAN